VRVGRAFGAVLGAVALLLAAAVALLAADVRRSGAELRGQDVAFETDPLGAHHWSFMGWAPANLGVRLFGLGDDFRFRRAAQRFRVVSRDPLGLEAVRLRHETEHRLMQSEEADPAAARRSETQNLLGVLAFVDSRHDEAAGSDLLRGSIDRFTKAVQLDPSNEAAKFNLELALTLLGGAGLPQTGNGRGNQAAAAGAVASPPGSGY